MLAIVMAIALLLFNLIRSSFIKLKLENIRFLSDSLWEWKVLKFSYRHEYISIV